MSARRITSFEAIAIPSFGCASVVLPDVAESTLEHVVVTDLELDVEGLAERLLDEAVAVTGVLPAFEADGADDLVDFVDDVFDDDRRLVALQRFEQLGQRRFGAFLARNLRDR